MVQGAIIATNPREQHAAFLDAETPLHFGIGVTAGILGISTTAAVLAAIGLEVAFVSMKHGPAYAVFGKSLPASSLGNHAADVLATVSGVYVGRWLMQRFG